MIILDTNQLVATPITGIGGVVLRAVAEDAGITLAISSLTFDEYRSRRLRDAGKRIDTARSAFESLRKLADGWPMPRSALSDPGGRDPTRP
jgi:hypothetical protein